MVGGGESPTVPRAARATRTILTGGNGTASRRRRRRMLLRAGPVASLENQIGTNPRSLAHAVGRARLRHHQMNSRKEFGSGVAVSSSLCLPANASLGAPAMTFDGSWPLRRRCAHRSPSGPAARPARAGPAPGELLGTDDDFGHLEGAAPALPARGVIRLGFRNPAGQEESFGQPLAPLLAPVGGRHDRYAAPALRPLPGKHQNHWRVSAKGQDQPARWRPSARFARVITRGRCGQSGCVEPGSALRHSLGREVAQPLLLLLPLLLQLSLALFELIVWFHQGRKSDDGREVYGPRCMAVKLRSGWEKIRKSSGRPAQTASVAGQSTANRCRHLLPGVRDACVDVHRWCATGDPAPACRRSALIHAFWQQACCRLSRCSRIVWRASAKVSRRSLWMASQRTRW